MHDATFAGLGGARRNLAVAVVRDGALRAACEQERRTRARAAGFSASQTPPFIADMLALAGAAGDRVVYASGEEGFAVDAASDYRRFAHREAHAYAAFLTSPFDRATILVCDGAGDASGGVTLWRGDGAEVTQIAFEWEGPGFARLFSDVTEVFGFAPRAGEHRFEALARAGRGDADEPPLFAWRDDRVHAAPDWQPRLATRAASARLRGVAALADLASATQRQITDALVAALPAIRDAAAAGAAGATGTDALCLAGGLFYNSSVTSAVASSGIFGRVFAPPHPGNPGLAIGTALAAAGERAAITRPPQTAFLGPEYGEQDTKRLLENCKLTYDYVDDETLYSVTAEAIARGRLVGWYQGRMEWGPRALGHRSILANPVDPHVLSNLNTFLKQGDDYRTYGIMLPEEEAAAWLSDPRPSPFMQLESALVDPARFRALLPYGTRRVRYQTVPRTATRLRRLLEAVASRTGCPILVNTSLNGFHEPIADTPRDAVRIFYGTGLDVLAIGNFLIRK